MAPWRSKSCRTSLPLAPRAVTFDRLVDTEFGPDQILRVIGPDGHAYTAHYIMQKQPDGTWMINGCYLTRGDDQSV